MTRDNFSVRRAEANKALLSSLGIVALLAVVFWGYRIMTAEKAAPVVPTADPVSFYCYDCKKTFELPPDQAASMVADPNTNRYVCNLCKKNSAVRGFGPSARMPGQP